VRAVPSEVANKLDAILSTASRRGNFNGSVRGHSIAAKKKCERTATRAVPPRVVLCLDRSSIARDTRRVQPKTLYARSGDVNIAYQVVGEGPLDLVYVGGFATHIELVWEEPVVARFFNRLASFSRLILIDKRGTGLSDPVAVTELPDLETRMDDVRAVMDAVDSERAALFGASEGGPMCLLFAATYPERTAALVLWSTYPRAIQDADFPEGWLPADEAEAHANELERRWRQGDMESVQNWGVSEGLTPLEEERVYRWFMKFQRLAVTPSQVAALARMGTNMDVRPVLPLISAPTLTLAREGDENAPATRYLAEHIPGARHVDFPGSAHLPMLSADQDAIMAEIEEFLTGMRPRPEPDRLLATILFTDIVGSTAKAAELGDRSWRDLLERHHALVRDELGRFDGTEIDTAGDGFFASFDGPARAIRCAGAIVEALGDLGLEVRAGLHIGECERMNGKVGGITVHIGARVASEAGPGEVLVSQTLRDIVAGSGIEFREQGVARLKGVPGEWRLFAVERDSRSGIGSR
jgi:pimeloyl-ACP methyl ester carboxylesterase